MIIICGKKCYSYSFSCHSSSYNYYTPGLYIIIICNIMASEEPPQYGLLEKKTKKQQTKTIQDTVLCTSTIIVLPQNKKLEL